MFLKQYLSYTKEYNHASLSLSSMITFLDNIASNSRVTEEQDVL